ncbi:MAG: 50S ribosomal protein L19 [Candidatus Pacebacteria bacterium]|nr:50S ribosomal protein L19 [Candidatus Paceibacterota bacterium]
MALSFNYNGQKVSVGDTVRVHQQISEGETQRIQVFEGIVIAIKNRGRNKSFTVRKIGANAVGVEKIYPVYLPNIKKIEVKRKGSVRRAKLYFLRDKQGRAATRVKEKKEYGQRENQVETEPKDKTQKNKNEGQAALKSEPRTKKEAEAKDKIQVKKKAGKETTDQAKKEIAKDTKSKAKKEKTEKESDKKSDQKESDKKSK